MSSEQHKMLLNRLAQKSGLMGGELSSQEVGMVGQMSDGGIVMTQMIGKAKNSSSEIALSDSDNFKPGQHFNGIVCVETSP